MPVLSILRALARALRRDLGGISSIKLNNFFLFIALLVAGAASSGVAPTAAEPFLALLGLLLLFPLAADPLAQIPRTRLGVWPISRWQRSALRALSLVLSPVFWLALLAVLKSGRPAVALGLLAVPVAGRNVASPRAQPLRWIPPLLRQPFLVLDTYVALVLSLSGTGYRLFAAHPDPAAWPILAMLVALSMSTYTQCLFSLDGPPGLARYRLLPLRGWQILLAKDAPWLLIVTILVLPLDAVAGLTFALTALAVGRYPAVRSHLHVERWRFVSGRASFGAVQMVLGAALGFQRLLVPAAAAWLLSLWLGGRSFSQDTVVRQ